MVIKEATLADLEELTCCGFIGKASYLSKIALGDNEADFNYVISCGETSNDNAVSTAPSPGENGRVPSNVSL